MEEGLIPDRMEDGFRASGSDKPAGKLKKWRSMS